MIKYLSKVHKYFKRDLFLHFYVKCAYRKKGDISSHTPHANFCDVE